MWRFNTVGQIKHLTLSIWTLGLGNQSIDRFGGWRKPREGAQLWRRSYCKEPGESHRDAGLQSARPEGKWWDRKQLHNFLLLPPVHTSPHQLDKHAKVKGLWASTDEPQLHRTALLSWQKAYKNTSWGDRTVHAAGRPIFISYDHYRPVFIWTVVTWMCVSVMSIKVFCCCSERAPLIYACQG